MQLPNGSGWLWNGQRKKSMTGEDGSYRAAQIDHGEDGSYRVAQFGHVDG